jgi:hypothetical protein
MSLLVIVNALNVVDAVCTYFATTSGEASEANPFVHAVGLPVKLVIVLAASVLLARWKPRALVWTAVVLAGVVAWHVSGIVLASQ